VSAGETQTAAAARGASAGLEPFRRRLDELDEQIARAFGERFQICREIALYKREHEIPMMQPGRVEEVRARYLARGAEVNLPADFTGALFELMIGATCKLEDELIDGAARDAASKGGALKNTDPEGAAPEDAAPEGGAR
jgi:chorismate mutase